jgi:hypothetical protein
MIDLGKKTTMLLGVAAVGVAGYLIWKKNQKPKVFVDLKGPSPSQFGVVGQTASGQLIFSGTRGTIILPQGVTPYTSATNGHWMACISGDCIYLTGPFAVGQTQISSL